MFYRELNQLREANPEQGELISRLDGYLSSLTGKARSNITASTVAAAVGAPRDKTIGLLMAAAKLGVLKLKYRVMCESQGHGLREYEKLTDIPREIYCDTCDETHQVTPDDIEYFFELTEKSASVRA